MAGGVFKRFLELVLDEKSAKKTERDTQKALKKATDPAVVGRNLATFAKDAARITAQAAAAVVGYAVALTKLTERGGQVLTVQRAFEASVGDTEAALSALRKATHGLIADYDLMVGFNRALSLGAVKTVGQFAEMSDVALRLGRALGVDAAFAMESLTLGIGRGSKLILDNLGIIVEGAVNVDTVMEAARKTIDRLGGDAVTNADQLGRVKTQFTNIKDEVAKFLAQSDALRTAFFEVGNILETIVLALQSEDRDTMVEAFKLTGSLAGTAFAAAMLDAVRAGFRAISDLITPGFLENKAQFVPVLGLFKSIADLAGVAADSGWSTVNALLAQGNALRRMLQTERELQGIRGGAGAGARGAGTGGGRGAPTSVGRRSIATPATAGLGGVGVPIFDLTPQTDNSEKFEELDNYYRQKMSDVESAGTTAALGIQSAFQDAFFALGEEGNAFGNFFEAIFRGAASSALSALAQLASAKVVENVANAFEQIARASAQAAVGNLAGAALHSASAKGFGLAALKWGLVGGAAGAAASAVGGGGGGSFRGSDAVGRQIDKLDRAGDIIIYVDGVDPKNPRHQALIGKTAAEYRQRSGTK